MAKWHIRDEFNHCRPSCDPHGRLVDPLVISLEDFKKRINSDKCQKCAKRRGAERMEKTQFCCIGALDQHNNECIQIYADDSSYYDRKDPIAVIQVTSLEWPKNRAVETALCDVIRSLLNKNSVSIKGLKHA